MSSQVTELSPDPNDLTSGLPVSFRRRAISVSEAACRWGVSRPTARKWLDQGRLPEFAEPVEVPGVAPSAHPLVV
jgi:hypothetical protein